VLTLPILEVLSFTDNSAKLIFTNAAMFVRLSYPGNSAEQLIQLSDRLRWPRLSEQISRIDKWSVCRV
jgi:hypothetical protein